MSNLEIEWLNQILQALNYIDNSIKFLSGIVIGYMILKLIEKGVEILLSKGKNDE